MENNMATESHPPRPPASPPQQLAELIHTLEQAILMAEQLPTTTDLSHQHVIFSSLHSVHLSLSSFLSHHHRPPTPSAAAILTNYTLPPENSISSAACGDDFAEPMQFADGDEMNSQSSVDKVEEKMRDFYIQNKRPKRRLSPSSTTATEQRRLGEEFAAVPLGFDPIGTKLRSLDLIYQFHG
ncbi:hypothetical protein Ancab_037788 [Ancistrocladus abbreviatus]